MNSEIDHLDLIELEDKIRHDFYHDYQYQIDELKKEIETQNKIISQLDLNIKKFQEQLNELNQSKSLSEQKF